MRDWTKPLLVVCVVVLGAGLFLLERRLSRLETELSAARSGIAAATALPGGSPGAAIAIPGDAVTQNRPSPTIVLQTPLLTRNADDLRHLELRQLGVQIVPPVQPVPSPGLQRAPSGVINGVPYYHIEIADSK
ncbi:MAG: hypothetical protein JNG89_16965 [Planctomycetaceae bacterium]|nr:hypothetical protein [Planctomycetaceae bacterium]